LAVLVNDKYFKMTEGAKHYFKKILNRN
jgi:hypothetical protein